MRPSRPSRLLITAGLAAVAFLAAFRAAWSKEEFPGIIAGDLGAATAPPCGLCHQYGKTGGDTLVTPFALAMRARGLSGEGSLDEALARVEADHVDSDGDGATDTDEIIAGTDPNSAASTPATRQLVSDPQLGCAVGRARMSQDAGWELGAGASLAALASLAARRRRRQSGVATRSSIVTAVGDDAPQGSGSRPRIAWTVLR